MKTVSIEKFFPPSTGLTRRLIQTMREQSVRDLQHSIQSVGPDQGDSEGSEPWTDLLKAADQSQQTAEEIAADQRWLSEILYGYLARLTYSQASASIAWFNFVEAIPPGMSNRLGLDDSKGLALLEELAIEFQQWLAQRPSMSFEAGWGVIWVNAADLARFGVTRFSVSRNEDKLPTLTNVASSNALSAGGARAFATTAGPDESN
jgi:hypothetical protein